MTKYSRESAPDPGEILIAAGKAISRKFGFTNCEVRISWASEVEIRRAKGESQVAEHSTFGENRVEEYDFSEKKRTLKLVASIRDMKLRTVEITASHDALEAVDVWIREVRAYCPAAKFIVNGIER